MLKNRKMKIKIFTFNLTQLDNAMLLRVDEQGWRWRSVRRAALAET